MFKTKQNILFIAIILFTLFLVKKTISSFTASSVSENIDLKTVEWYPAKSSVFLIKDSHEYSLTENIDQNSSSNFQYSLNTDQNQYLSFQYKNESQNDINGFDEPNFLVKINDEIVFQNSIKDDEWRRAFINLKNYNSNNNNYLIEFRPQNSFDDLIIPNIKMKEVSTAKYLAKENDQIKFEVTKPNSTIILNYSVEENGIIVQKNLKLQYPYEFTITEHFYNNKIEYYSVDSYGNVEETKTLDIYTDFSPPEKITDLKSYKEGDLEVSLVFPTPADNFSFAPSFYKIKDETNYSQPVQINHKKFGSSNLPLFLGASSITNSSENILIRLTNSGTTLFSIQSVDHAGNQSQLSDNFELDIF